MFSKALLLTLSSLALGGAPEPEQSWGNEEPSSVSGATESHYRVGMTRSTLNSEFSSQLGLGRQLVDIEMQYNGAANIFAGVWKPVTGLVFPLFEATQPQYDAWLSDMASRSGRFLDIEITVRNGAYRFNGLFLQDGDDYAHDIRTRRSESAFRDLLANHSRDGYQLIDIEIGPNNSSGATIFSGVWVRHPNQPKTAVIYDLRTAEFSDILNPLSARVLDIERYTSDVHGEIRYAILLAMVPGATWRVSRGISQSTLNTLQNSTADGDTFLIDLDPRPDTSTFDAVWGEDAKTLRQVAPIADETNLIALDPGLAAQISDFETSDRSNALGMYARNLTTGASVGSAMDESFPLASMMKTAVHFRLWAAIAAGDRSRFSNVRYTEGEDKRDNWYNGNASDSGGLGVNEFGNTYNLSTYSAFMMGVSDNAATSILVDHPLHGVGVLSNNLTEWLAAIPGVGQGWGPLVSIHGVDRHILQRGSSRNFLNSESLFLAPPWAMEPLFRSSAPQANTWFLSYGNDFWGELADHFEPNSIPNANMIVGHERFHDSGINTATPRAYTRLYQAFLEDDIVPSSVRASMLSAMAGSGALLRHPSFPDANEAYSKSGGKGDSRIPVTHTRSNSSMFKIGDDWFVFAILGKHLSYTSSQLRAPNGGRYVNMSYAMLQNVAPNLVACENNAVTSSATTVTAGTTFNVNCLVKNNSSASSPSFQVDFRLSSDIAIETDDPLLGTVNVGAMVPGQETTITWQGTIPAGMSNGNYFAGVVVDLAYSNAASGNGNVGEWQEGIIDNGARSLFTISVGTASDPIFASDFE